MDFKLLSDRWLHEISETNKEYYESIWEYNYHGGVFLLFQHMKCESNHSILGFSSKLGRKSIGEEYCYFDVCEKLNEEDLKKYLNKLCEIATEQSLFLTSEYDFVFIGLVIVTGEFNDKDLKKKVKNFKCRKKSNIANIRGWLEARICIVDLSDNTIYNSKFGDNLKTRISNF